MNLEKRDFDKEAAKWDENPVRVKMADDIVSALSQMITLTPDMDVMDFGCGTGLIALRLAHFVKSMTGADSSQGMLDVLTGKAIRENFLNVRDLKLDPGNLDTMGGSYNIIVSNMAFHHIENIEPLLKRMYNLIKPSGYICISDLDSDDGQFHPDNTGVFHNGFDRKELRLSFTNAGFTDVKDITASEIVKPAISGELRKFTIFMMVGRKQS